MVAIINTILLIIVIVLLILLIILRFKKIKKEQIVIVDPERLNKKRFDIHKARNYQKYKGRKYTREEIIKLGMFDREGKEVRHWKLFKSKIDSNMDEFIPIYRKKPGPKK
jgi:hypothetical protein